MTSYSLLIVSAFPQFKENCLFSSTEMFAGALATHFGRLPHVRLLTRDYNDTTELPEADVALVHAYFDSWIWRHLSELKPRVKSVVNFMECAHQQADWNYCYDGMPGEKLTTIQLPVVKASYSIQPKRPGSILLDHDFAPHEEHPLYDWNKRFWDFFERRGAADVWSLERDKTAKIPSFIKRIPRLPFRDYLTATDSFERYIVTHHGSYNHSAVDMAVRGTQVIVPKTNHHFIPSINVSLFGAKVIGGEEDLVQILKTPPEFNPVLENATDIEQIVQQMDNDFQRGFPFAN